MRALVRQPRPGRDRRYRHLTRDPLHVALRGRARRPGGRAGRGGHDVRPELGFELLLPIFAAVILGGIGDAFGALAGGIVLGLVIEWSTLLRSSRAGRWLSASRS